MLCAAKALKFGYRWVVGNGEKVRFWEDTWHGTAPLATHFWELYSIANEKNKTVADIRAENELRLTFRSTFSLELFQKWLELEEIVKEMHLNGDEESGVY